MSEVVESGFTTRGYESVPNLYNDRVHKKPLITSMGTAALRGLLDQYNEFLERDIMPHHEAQARHFRRHLQFELEWRESRGVEI